MTYLALARKWRPKSFDEMVGQDHVVRALSNALDSGRVHHAYLFAGTRGVGKTTLARILAKAHVAESWIHDLVETWLERGIFVSALALGYGSDKELRQFKTITFYSLSFGKRPAPFIDTTDRYLASYSTWDPVLTDQNVWMVEG